MKLATALYQAYKDQEEAVRVMQEINIMDDDIFVKSGMLNGRQWVRRILDHFKTDRCIDKMWQIEDHYKVPCPGDAALGAFRFSWHKWSAV